MNRNTSGIFGSRNNILVKRLVLLFSIIVVIVASGFAQETCLEPGFGPVIASASESHPLSATGPTVFFGFPNFLFEFDADYSDAVSVYGVSVVGIDMNVEAHGLTKACWVIHSSSPGSVFGASGSTCIQHDGAGDDCIAYVAKCFPHGGDPTTATGAQCPTSPASDIFFTDSFTTTDPTPTPTNAFFFTANENPAVNDFRDIILPGAAGVFCPGEGGGCFNGDPIKGGTSGTNSVFVDAEDAPIKITIISPTATNYTLNQTVLADYSCTTTTTGTILTCNGPVATGQPIDTSTPGSHDFTVNATGVLVASPTIINTAQKTVTYTVGIIGLPTDKNQCKKGGWQLFVGPRRFKNQGDCVSFVNNGK